MAMLHYGAIGDVLIAKCWNWQKRGNIGRQKPNSPPSGVDYDMWVGPAEWPPSRSRVVLGGQSSPPLFSDLCSTALSLASCQWRRTPSP
jgi:hypothetical protein